VTNKAQHHLKKKIRKAQDSLARYETLQEHVSRPVLGQGGHSPIVYRLVLCFFFGPSPIDD